MQETRVEGGKTAKYALNIERAERVHKVIAPMSNTTRLAGYEKTNAGRPLSGAQLRRLARHDAKCALDDGDQLYRPHQAPWQARFARMREIRQNFKPTIDNVRRPTGRVGIARFGPAAGLDALDKLLFGSRKGEKGMDLGTNALASQRGRIMARTGHGRRRNLRHSSRGR